MSESTPDTIVTPRPREKEETRTKRLPPYNVILENDDYHSFEFVIEVIRKVFGYDDTKAFQLTDIAHHTGRVVVWTGAKEVAELKVEQVQGFNEIRADGSKFGPLGVYIEPAPGG